jgi:simple sugar transport system substrate-binding protein
MKKKFLAAFMCATMVMGLFTGCGDTETEDTSSTNDTSSTTTADDSSTTTDDASTADDSSSSSSDGIVVGFSQVGAESDWRTANTESMKSTFSEENGYTLKFDDAQQKQENQIKAIRSFIEQEVDYIVLAPVTETGWDTVLQDAKDAGIPVIIVDRMVEVSDDSLYTAWVGSNFELEGQKACAWLKAYADAKGLDSLNIVDIQGTIGASAQIGRTKGLEAAVEANGWNLLAEQTGEFTQAKGQEVMESFIKQYGDEINVVYCENDNEAFGAIDALTAAGYEVGSDIANGQVMVMSFDSTNAGMTSTLSGDITCNTECNPLHGPRVREIIEALEAGQEVEKQQYVEEEIFAQPDDVTSIDVDGTSYDVTIVTQDVIDSRAY